MAVDRERLKKILAGDVKELNLYAKEKAKEFLEARKETEKLSTSQIRSVLDEIQRIIKFEERRLQLLRPKLAYAAGRHRGKVKDLQELLDTAIQMTDQRNFEDFKSFVEALVAYHRYYGGK